MKTSTVLASAVAFASTVLAVPSPVSPNNLAPRATLDPITVKGNAFFKGTERFYIRGVDYQPGGSSKLIDPLADPAICKRDIVKFKELGANVIRIYSVDNTANHDVCMQALADAGIYLVLDANTPNYSINRANPGPSYNAVYLQNVFATIDAFAKYTNTLAFFSGNEVINDDKTTACAPYVKAVTRDMRQYLGSRGYRKIPVGYSAADVAESRMEMAHYMNCGTDDERSDFFSFNDYSYCSPSSFKLSGWDQKVKNFTGYGLPIFLSEYGCIKPRPRTFDEVSILYSSDMTAVYSGGLAYEYSEEESGYGLVKINDSTTITELDDFKYLSKALAAAKPPTGDGGYSATSTASQCPAQSSNWNVTSAALPTIPKKALEYMTKGAGTGAGFTGDGSQTAGGDGISSSGTAVAGSATVTGGAKAASSSAAANPGVVVPFDSRAVYMGAVILLSFLGGGLLL